MCPPINVTTGDPEYSVAWTVALRLEADGFAVHVNPPGSELYDVRGAHPDLVVYGRAPHSNGLVALADVWRSTSLKDSLRRHSAVAQALHVPYLVLAEESGCSRLGREFRGKRMRIRLVPYRWAEQGSLIVDIDRFISAGQ